MVEAKRNVRAETIRHGQRHCLFVEGKDDKAIDPVVLRELLHDRIRVRPLGPSYHVQSVAEALHKEHPDYYFLVDRDHYGDSFVQRCWDRFPDPATSNLLVWFRRELENYFLIPEYAIKSQFCRATETKLRQTILQCCRRRLFLDAANQVIISLREDLKGKWVSVFSRLSEFKTKEAALDKLTNLPELAEKKTTTSKLLGKRRLQRAFLDILDKLTGGVEPLKYGHGRWLELLAGKAILPTVVNRCFAVRDANGNALQGKRKLNEVAKDLARLPLEDQPEDFQRLHAIILKRVTA